MIKKHGKLCHVLVKECLINKKNSSMLIMILTILIYIILFAYNSHQIGISLLLLQQEKRLSQENQKELLTKICGFGSSSYDKPLCAS